MNNRIVFLQTLICYFITGVVKNYLDRNTFDILYLNKYLFKLLQEMIKRCIDFILRKEFLSRAQLAEFLLDQRIGEEVRHSEKAQRIDRVDFCFINIYIFSFNIYKYARHFK